MGNGTTAVQKHRALKLGIHDEPNKKICDQSAFY